MGISWRDKPKTEQQADLNRYKAAKRALNNYMPRDRNEDSTFRQLNAAVLEAEKEIPSWRR